MTTIERNIEELTNPISRGGRLWGGVEITSSFLTFKSAPGTSYAEYGMLDFSIFGSMDRKKCHQFCPPIVAVSSLSLH